MSVIAKTLLNSLANFWIGNRQQYVIMFSYTHIQFTDRLLHTYKYHLSVLSRFLSILTARVTHHACVSIKSDGNLDSYRGYVYHHFGSVMIDLTQCYGLYCKKNANVNRALFAGFAHQQVMPATVSKCIDRTEP